MVLFYVDDDHGMENMKNKQIRERERESKHLMKCGSNQKEEEEEVESREFNYHNSC